MDRIYHVKFEERTEHEPVKGWYIDDEPGLPIGPYRTRGEAAVQLVELLDAERCAAGRDDQW